jgi:hypothetical protein
MRRASLTTDWRYGRCGMSESDTDRSDPVTESISNWTFDWISGCRTIRAMIHSRRMATVSVPLKIISCNNNSKITIKHAIYHCSDNLNGNYCVSAMS